DEHPTVLRHRDCMVSHSHAPSALDHKIKLLRLDVLVQRVCALRRKPPEPGAKKLAFGPLKKIRVGDFHDVRKSPTEIVRFDQTIAINRFHVHELDLPVSGSASSGQRLPGRDIDRSIRRPSEPAKDERRHHNLWTKSRELPWALVQRYAGP